MSEVPHGKTFTLNDVIKGTVSLTDVEKNALLTVLTVYHRVGTEEDEVLLSSVLERPTDLSTHRSYERVVFTEEGCTLREIMCSLCEASEIIRRLTRNSDNRG